MVSAQARREQVDYAVGRGRSVRRACALLQVSRSALGYVSTLPARDAELAGKLEQISAAHAAYGHRFAWALLRRAGSAVNKKRVRRVWRRLGLHVRKKKRRKLRTGQARVFAAMGPNQVWAYNFTLDRCANGQVLKSLSIVDEWTRECLAIEVRSSLPAERVIAVLERLFEQYGAPQVLRSDNVPTRESRAIEDDTIPRRSLRARVRPTSCSSLPAVFHVEAIPA